MTAQELAAFQNMGQHLAVLVEIARECKALLIEIRDAAPEEDDDEQAHGDDNSEMGELMELAQAAGVDTSKLQALGSLNGGGGSPMKQLLNLLKLSKKKKIPGATAPTT